MTSRLDRDRYVMAEIIACLAEGGLSGQDVDHETIQARLTDTKITIQDYMGIMVWLEDEGLFRHASGMPRGHTGRFYRAQLSSKGLGLLGLTSPLDGQESVEVALANDDSPESRTKIGEFIGSVLGSGLSSFIRGGSGG